LAGGRAPNGQRRAASRGRMGPLAFTRSAPRRENTRGYACLVRGGSLHISHGMATEAHTKIWEQHELACSRGEATYRDPATGYQVMTRVGLVSRGQCCGSGCRHCPFEHAEVPSERRPPEARWLHEAELSAAPADGIDVLFWSGGKDSYAAYLDLQQERARPCVLLTTYDGVAGRVAHQELSLEVIRRQARALDVPSLAVPLARGGAYVEQVERGLQKIIARGRVSRLVFGDLHLAEIRRWREAMLGSVAAAAGATLHFPLWGVDYGVLRRRLKASGATFRVCASQIPGALSVGSSWSPAPSAELPDSVDPFGEWGEFHTEVVFPTS